MTMTSYRRAVLATLAALGCGCAAQSGSVSAPPELAPALGAVCDLIARCPGQLPPIAARSRGECIDIVYWATTCRLEDDGVARHPLPLDGDTAQACGAFLSGLSCDRVSCLFDGGCPEGVACAGLFNGLGEDSASEDVVGPGEHCYRYGTPNCDAQHFCAPEAYDAEHGVNLCEVCVPRLAAGERCDVNAPRSECRAGLVCARSPTDGTGVCEAPRADGMPCITGEECTSELCGNSVCRSGGHAGDACAENYECRPEERLTCIEGSCQAARPLGEPCAEEYDCLNFARCHSDGRCGLPDGVSCGSSQNCRSGYCGGTCQAPLANGAACSERAMCASGYCDSVSSTCADAPPPQPVGGSCADASECEEGLSCDRTCYRPCDADGCPAGLVCMYTGRSECLPPRSAGSSCEQNEDCESGFCSDDEVCGIRPGIGDPCTGYGDCYPLGYCSGGVCAARRRPDESCEGLDSCLHPFICQSGRCRLISLACEPAGVGQQCTYLRFCAPEAYCDFSSFTCRARHGVGQACTSLGRLGDDCAPGLHCVGGPTGSTCQARVAEGGACTAEDLCVEGTFCVGGTCMVSAGGNPCRDASECAEGTFCDDRSDVCEPFRQSGDECQPSGSDNALCDPELYCARGAPSTCQARPGLGETCGDDSGCAPGLTCSDSSGGTCVARVALGGECEQSFGDRYGSNCAEDLYCNDDVFPYVCASRLPLGDACGSSWECLSNICDSNRCVSRAECVLPGTL